MIFTVTTPEQWDAFAGLVSEYVASLAFQLTFQDVEREIEDLPAEYGPPGGRALLATAGDGPAGGVGVRRLDEHTCEMKRMFVRPAFRGRGLGRALGTASLDAGRAMGYRRMRLDSIESMSEAIALYRSLGFIDIEPYRYNPLPGAIFLEKEL